MTNHKMEKDKLKMSLLMGFTMSLVLSLVGNLSSGRFTIPGCLKSFAVSFVISFLIGHFIPIAKISASLMRKLELKPGTLQARLVSAGVSALLYTPFMTFAMVFLAHRQLTAQGIHIPFLPMLFRSECISILVSYALSFLITPLYTKLIFKKDAR